MEISWLSTEYCVSDRPSSPPKYRGAAVSAARDSSSKDGEAEGVTAISIYEKGERYPSYEVLLRIAAVFHVSTDYLLGLDDTPKVSLEGLSEDNVRLVLELVEALRGK